jgi:hypothetical protein
MAMSALGQKQTSGHVRVMSALPRKADIANAMRNVRFVPKADIGVEPVKCPLSRRIIGGDIENKEEGLNRKN